MGLAGRPRAAGPLHAGRKTRPLRRERKKDRKWGLRVTQRDRKKEEYLPPALFQERNSHDFSWENRTEQVHHGYMTQDTKRSSLFSLSDMLPAFTTNCSSRSLKWKHSGHQSDSAGRVTCPGLATLVSDLVYGLLVCEHILLTFPHSLLLWLMTAQLSSKFNVLYMAC